MSEIILYPTETVYGLGVNAFSQSDWQELCRLKNRSSAQTASWLVRSVDDIERMAEVTEKGREIMNKYLPGPLTVVFKAKDSVPVYCRAADGTVSFRISSDPLAQELINEYMEKSGGVPLTCTSANLHGLPSEISVKDILSQFNSNSNLITRVIDGGVRSGVSSTVVSFINDEVKILRQGAVELKL